MLWLWPKRTHETSVPKTEGLMHSSSKRGQSRRDHQDNWGEPWRRHKRWCVSRGRNSFKKGENLNESSDEDEEMYLWDEIEYKVNYVQFLSNKTVTEKQMQVASAMINKLEEPVYDHRTRIKERSWPLQKCNDNQPISVFWEIQWATKLFACLGVLDCAFNIYIFM